MKTLQQYINEDISDKVKKIREALFAELSKEKYKLTFRTKEPIFRINRKSETLQPLIKHFFKNVDDETMFFVMACDDDGVFNFNDHPTRSQGTILSGNGFVSFNYYLAVNGNHVQIIGVKYGGITKAQEKPFEFTIDI